MKLQILSIKFWALIALLPTFACVSAGKYKELEANHAQTQTQLAQSENQKTELEKKLGITSQQKNSLESSVTDMKKALSEAEERKHETEKRLAEFQELTSKFKSLVDAGNFAIESENWERLSEINSGLLNLLPKGAEKEATTRIGFGL